MTLFSSFYPTIASRVNKIFGIIAIVEESLTSEINFTIIILSIEAVFPKKLSSKRWCYNINDAMNSCKPTVFERRTVPDMDHKILFRGCRRYYIYEDGVIWGIIDTTNWKMRLQATKLSYNHFLENATRKDIFNWYEWTETYSTINRQLWKEDVINWVL